MATPERRTRHKLGEHLRNGVHLRSMPPIETPWIGTFNLRWWQHVDQEHAADSPPDGAVKLGRGRWSNS